MNKQFMSQSNETMLDRILYADFQRRINRDLNEKQKERLVKTVHHYMQEVHSSTSNGSVTELNKEVLGLVVQDFTSYLRRSEISNTSSVDNRMVDTNNIISDARLTDNRMANDVGSRFNSLQNERSETKTLQPPAPDFRIPIEDSSDIPALSLFEMAKKNREAEAQRIASDVDTNTFSGTFLKDLQLEPKGSGMATVNPTIAKPEIIRIKPALPQDIIIPQDDILSYKENEYNLVVYSADRDWYNNTKENRYNFSVIFNPANNGPGLNYSPATNRRFNNIVRIEMVKALLPLESNEILIRNNSNSGSAFTGLTDARNTVLSYPTIVIHVDELESNVNGTNDTLDRAFATLQYDAQWNGDGGSSYIYPSYLAMIPKFLKCQRVYTPTPLSTLTKLTIQLQLPNGELVNSALDTLNIANIWPCSRTGIADGSIVITNTKYFTATTSNNLRDGASGNSLYFVIVTSTYFSRWLFQINDLINIQGVNTSLISGNESAKTDFLSYIQQSAGLRIVQTGYISGGTTPFDTANNVGFCNFMVVESRFADPTTGSTSIQPFGGTTALSIALETAMASVTFTGAKLINLSKQTQLTFRIITRDMDSSTRIRPNNA
jgi:hypothetical protein